MESSLNYHLLHIGLVILIWTPHTIKSTVRIGPLDSYLALPLRGRAFFHPKWTSPLSNREQLNGDFPKNCPVFYRYPPVRPKTVSIRHSGILKITVRQIYSQKTVSVSPSGTVDTRLLEDSTNFWSSQFLFDTSVISNYSVLAGDQAMDCLHSFYVKLKQAWPGFSTT